MCARSVATYAAGTMTAAPYAAIPESVRQQYADRVWNTDIVGTGTAVIHRTRIPLYVPAAESRRRRAVR